MVSGPPECPGDTTYTGRTPWRRDSWARPSNGPETYGGCNHLGPYPVMTRAQMKAGLDLLPAWALEQRSADTGK